MYLHVYLFPWAKSCWWNGCCGCHRCDCGFDWPLMLLWVPLLFLWNVLRLRVCRPQLEIKWSSRQLNTNAFHHLESLLASFRCHSLYLTFGQVNSSVYEISWQRLLFGLKHTWAPYLRSPLWKWLQTLRGVRIINVLVGLFFSVHLLACGWYMCASLHANVQVPNGAKWRQMVPKWASG